MYQLECNVSMQIHVPTCNTRVPKHTYPVSTEHAFLEYDMSSDTALHLSTLSSLIQDQIDMILIVSATCKLQGIMLNL